MKKYCTVKLARLLKLKNKHSGYVLLFLMLIIGSLGLYLSYQMSLTKMNTQSWQLTKTATEFSYWFDVEQNYEQDYSIIEWSDLNNIQLSTLIQNHYLPYGTARTPTFASLGTPAVTAVSAFQCSPLPGITTADGNLSDSGAIDQTCPATTGSPLVQCTLNQPAYYSCVTNSAISQAQYYINANHIALSGGPNKGSSTGNSSGAPIALGLIVRTPGFSNAYIALGASGSRGLLPNGSYAQSLITTLPSSSFNLYSTDDPEVKGIGIGSYLGLTNGTNPNTPVANDRYSKIIDMGLVQAVDLSNPSATKCYGWNNNGNKLGVETSYTGSGDPTGTSTTKSFPPTCIRINTLKYGPGGTEKCARLDLFYTVYRNYLQKDATTSSWNGYLYGGYDTASTRLFSSTDSMVTNSSSVSNYLDVYLGQTIQGKNTSPGFTNYSYYPYSSNKIPPTSTSLPEEYNWLAYFIRCTRNNT